MTFLAPEPDEDSGPFWEWCTRGELRIQRCSGCGRRRVPPRPMCPWCRSWAAEWEAVSGQGRVWSFVVAHPPLLPAYAAKAPYNVIVVELDEDPTIRLVGNLVTSADSPVGDVDPVTIAVGDPVRVVFGPEKDGLRLPRWVRA